MERTLQDDFRTTLDSFHAFLDTCPDREKWELIDGEPILHATPSRRHQIIVGSLLFELETIRREARATWQPLIGIGTRIPDDRENEIVPDIMILPRVSEATNWTYEVLAAFEVLSPDSVRRDMVRKLAFYRRVEHLTHYVVLSQERRQATLFARNAGFSPRVLAEDGATIKIEPLGIALRLADLYLDVATD